MSVTIVIKSMSGEIRQSPYVIVDQEVRDYLGSLKSFVALQTVATLDPYADTSLSEQDTEALTAELARLQELAKSQQLPRPPAYVGLEGGENGDFGERFGWPGLVAFLSSFRCLLEVAKEDGSDVVAIGD